MRENKKGWGGTTTRETPYREKMIRSHNPDYDEKEDSTKRRREEDLNLNICRLDRECVRVTVIDYCD